MDLVRKEDIISESWADFEQNIESKLADFKQSISSDMDSSDSAKIEILERQVNEILKKINEREV
jgi:polyhydroxyalkanoate synthesis regulator phasin